MINSRTANSMNVILFILVLTTSQSTQALLERKIVWNSAIAQDTTIKGTQIGVVELRGPIRNSKEIVLQLQTMMHDASIKAVLLLIDSPGGSAGHAYSIFNEIKNCRAKKTTVAFVEDMACSGGYLAACGAHAIVMSGGGSIGSIGVILGSDYRVIPSYYNDGHMAGEVEYDPITAGKFKDVLNPHRELSSEDREHLQNDVDKMYNLFCETIAQERNITLSEHEIWADGKIFNAQDAYALKLIDKIGSLSDALEFIKTTLTMKGTPTSNIILVGLHKPDKKNTKSEPQVA